MAANNKQIGGTHYLKLKIQPWDYVLANNLGPLEHLIIKYITRWRDKGGVKDLDKVIHTAEKLKEWYFSVEKEAQIACDSAEEGTMKSFKMSPEEYEVMFGRPYVEK